MKIGYVFVDGSLIGKDKAVKHFRDMKMIYFEQTYSLQKLTFLS